ncbi:MAG: hypothetical protein QOH52_2620 [Pseudonocardiales bacterium]|nr:hypothetical protein [Jatrophihabitans sp.]MDT4904604.1 hypothetical protein [Pseudonocardiales bacterium]
MSDVSRRAVLRAGAAAVGLFVIGAQPGSTTAAAVKSAAKPKVLLPARAHYARSVGKTFTATHGKRTYRLKLANIRDVAGTSAKRREQCFNLIFIAAGKTPPPEAIYTLKRKGVHTHLLLVSRLGAGQSMQALVSRSM